MRLSGFPGSNRKIWKRFSKAKNKLASCETAHISGVVAAVPAEVHIVIPDNVRLDPAHQPGFLPEHRIRQPRKLTLAARTGTNAAGSTKPTTRAQARIALHDGFNDLNSRLDGGRALRVELK